jgi:hypothetical protein
VKLDAQVALEFNGCVFEAQVVDPQRHHEILQRLALGERLRQLEPAQDAILAV